MLILAPGSIFAGNFSFFVFFSFFFHENWSPSKMGQGVCVCMRAVKMRELKVLIVIG